MLTDWLDMTLIVLTGSENFKQRNYPNNYEYVMRKPVYAICEQQFADQSADPHSLISASVVCCLDSIMLLLTIAEISRP